ncbi:MAG: hypothetical protein IRY84_07805, partial [Thermobispora bispora]|nr:hypothetical protein [Thermobispora bispora]
MAFTWKNSFNGGSNGTTITTANSGGTSGTAFSSVDGSPTYTTTNATGLRAPLVGRFASSSDIVKWSVSLAARTIYARTHVYRTGNPSSSATLIWFYDGFGGTTLRLLSTGRVAVATDAFDDFVPGTTTTDPIPANQWVRLEVKLVYGTTSNSGSCELRVYHSADSGTPTETKTATGADLRTSLPVSVWFWGVDGITVYHDDLGVSDVTWVGPNQLNANVTPSVLAGTWGMPAPAVSTGVGVS